jgi:hypothetical protein
MITAEAADHCPQPKAEYNEIDFDASVKDVCTNLRKANCQNQFYEYTLRVDSLDLAFGYEHLKVFYCC